MTSLDVPFRCGNCGGLVDLTIQVEGDVRETREVAVTCDCGKVQWLTLRPITEPKCVLCGRGIGDPCGHPGCGRGR